MHSQCCLSGYGNCIGCAMQPFGHSGEPFGLLKCNESCKEGKHMHACEKRSIAHMCNCCGAAFPDLQFPSAANFHL